MKDWKNIIDTAKEYVKKHGYVNRTKLALLEKYFKVNRFLLFKKLLEHKIPFDHKKHAILLNALGVPSVEHVIKYEDFCKLGIWRNKLFKFSKENIEFICKECSEESKIKLKNILGRKYLIGEPICPGCIMKAVTNTDKWKKVNSEAQLVAQNKPEQIIKNRQAQIKRHENPETRLKHSEASKKVWARPGHKEKMTNIALKKWEDPVYAEKVIKNTKRSQMTGDYKGFFYNSSYELAFLLKEETNRGNLDHIKRFYGFISYFDTNGVTRHYYPDFLIDDNLVIEVKGYGPWVNLDLLERKHSAANVWCRNNNKQFRLVTIKDIPSFLIKKAKQIHCSN